MFRFPRPTLRTVANHIYRLPQFSYDIALRLFGDWKWNAALAVFALFTAFVVIWNKPVSTEE
jgi:hypothetical protein